MRTKTQMEWQPIDTAPKDGRRILVFTPTRKPVLVRWWRGRWTIYGYEDSWFMKWIVGAKEWLALSDEQEPTHWHPLPAPPIPQTQGKEA